MQDTKCPVSLGSQGSELLPDGVACGLPFRCMQPRSIDTRDRCDKLGPPIDNVPRRPEDRSAWRMQQLLLLGRPHIRSDHDSGAFGPGNHGSRLVAAAGFGIGIGNRLVAATAQRLALARTKDPISQRLPSVLPPYEGSERAAAREETGEARDTGWEWGLQGTNGMQQFLFVGCVCVCYRAAREDSKLRTTSQQLPLLALPQRTPSPNQFPGHLSSESQNPISP